MRALLLLAVGVVVPLTACSETCGDASHGGDVGDGAAQDLFEEVYDQGLSEYLGTIEPSEVVESGAETYYMFDPADGPMCLRGADYWMSVRPGSQANLVIYQQGGGACWSEQCNAFNTAGTPSVPADGLLNPSLESNALSDWNVAYLPYCDGSLFLGDVEIDDDLDGQIDRFHHGLINLSAGLDVVHERFPDPERIVLAGSSAGAYGVHVSDMLVRRLWPDAELIVVADSGLGIGRPGDFEFIPNLLEEWDALRLIPESCPNCVTDHITGMVDWQLDRDPNLRFAVISSYDDAIIADVFLRLGPGEYEVALSSESARLAASHPGRYNRFLFDGSLHTTLTTDSQNGGEIPGLIGSYDQSAVKRTTVAEWLSLLINECSSFDDLLE